MIKQPVAIITLLGVWQLSSPATAGTIYTTYLTDTSEGTQSVLAVVDPVTGLVSEIGLTGADRVGALTYDPIGGRLLGLGRNEFGDSSLYEIDTASGIATEIGALGANIGAGGLAFHTGHNTLYAGQFVSTNEGFGQLVSVDLDTGAATPVGNIQAELSVSLAYYPPSGQLLFTSGFEEFGAPFGSWDPVTGIQTTIGPTATIFGMDYDPDVDVLYGINGGVSATGGLGDKLFTIDPLTGQATLLVTLDRAEFYSSLAIIPIPAPPAAFALAPLALIAARRRR